MFFMFVMFFAQQPGKILCVFQQKWAGSCHTFGLICGRTFGFRRNYAFGFSRYLNVFIYVFLNVFANIAKQPREIVCVCQQKNEDLTIHLDGFAAEHLFF